MVERDVSIHWQALDYHFSIKRKKPNLIAGSVNPVVGRHSRRYFISRGINTWPGHEPCAKKRPSFSACSSRQTRPPYHDNILFIMVWVFAGSIRKQLATQYEARSSSPRKIRSGPMYGNSRARRYTDNRFRLCQPLPSLLISNLVVIFVLPLMLFYSPFFFWRYCRLEPVKGSALSQYASIYFTIIYYYGIHISVLVYIRRKLPWAHCSIFL